MKTINEKYRLKGDKVIWAVYIVFIIISLTWVFSSMGKTVYEKQGGNISLMLSKHFFLLLSGFALCYISHLILVSPSPLSTFRLSYLLLLLFMVLLSKILKQHRDGFLFLCLDSFNLPKLLNISSSFILLLSSPITQKQSKINKHSSI